MDTTTKKTPACPSCGRACEPGSTWKGSNLCKGALLLSIIERAPGHSTWELAELSGVPYTECSRAMLKLREYGAVATTSEEREQGGQRYRYYPNSDPAAKERFLVTLHRVEVLQ